MEEILESVSFLKDNVFVYLLLSLITYFLGGLDESLLTLFFFNILDILLSFSSKKKARLSSKFRIYVVIMLGVMIDRMLKLETEIRYYLLIYYSYNEIINILNKVCEDKSIKIPEKLQKLINLLGSKKE